MQWNMKYHSYLITICRPQQTLGFFDEFGNLLDEVTAMPGDQCICSDTNIPSSTGHIDKQLQQIIDHYDLCQHVHDYI